MKNSQYTAEQIAFAMRQAESGIPVPDVCRKMGISEQTEIKPRSGLPNLVGRRSHNAQQEIRKDMFLLDGV